MKVKSKPLEKQFEISELEDLGEQNELTYPNGIKFQRLMQGSLLLLALLFQWIPLVYFVFLVMGTAACFSHEFALFSILYTKIIKSGKSSSKRECECSPKKS